jgi:pimeloyl-ACP methyl ester carboxylesterase
VPVLLLSGEYDPVTPPDYARLAAETLDNARLYLFPGIGHATFTQPCPMRIITGFFDDPTAPPDDICVTVMEPPPFRTRE